MRFGEKTEKTYFWNDTIGIHACHLQPKIITTKRFKILGQLARTLTYCADTFPLDPMGNLDCSEEGNILVALEWTILAWANKSITDNKIMKTILNNQADWSCQTVWWNINLKITNHEYRGVAHVDDTIRQILHPYYTQPYKTVLHPHLRSYWTCAEVTFLLYRETWACTVFSSIENTVVRLIAGR